MRAVLVHLPVCALLLFAQPSKAQNYCFTFYTPKDGLVNNRSHFISQDSRGRLYIGTFSGLSVYDGTRWINYTAEDGLGSGLVNDVVEMGDDSLWVIPNTRALHCLVHGNLRNLYTADGYYPIINQLIHCSDGFYYAISDDGLFRYENRRFVRITLRDSSGIDVSNYIGRALEVNGLLLMVNDPNLYSYPHAGNVIAYDLRTRKLLVSQCAGRVLCIATTSQGDVYAAMDIGLRRVDTGALRKGEMRWLAPSRPYNDLANVPGNWIFFDHTGDCWMATPKALVLVDKEGNEQRFSVANGFPSGFVTYMYEDREHNMWFCSEQNGIVKLANREVRTYSQAGSGLHFTDLFVRQSTDSVWFYDTDARNLVLRTRDNQKIYRGVGRIPPAWRIAFCKKAYLIAPHEIDEIRWVGRDMWKAVPVYRDSAELGGYLCTDSRGVLIDVGRKLLVLAGGRIAQQPIPYMADQVAVDKKDRIWVATRSSDLLVYQVDMQEGGPVLRLLHHYTNAELPVTGVRSVAVDDRGRVWIGTRDKGVFCLFFNGWKLDSLQQITMRNGLSENFISYLYSDGRDTIWACSPTSLDRISGMGGQLKIEHIMPCNDRYERVAKIGADAGNIHWVLTAGGCMEIVPIRNSGSDFVPRLFFSKVAVRDNNLSFWLAAPTFLSEDRTRYSYVLEGADDAQWSAPSPQSTINFVDLPPGRYTLRVRAQFLTGLYPDQSTEYAFTIQPRFWQTWWFRLALIVVPAVLIGLWVRSFMATRLEIQRSRLERQQAVEKERTRIATEMHDDLGAGLSRIKFLSETIPFKEQAGQRVQDELAKIGLYANEMIGKMGEIVWALDEKNDSLSDLLAYTRSYAAEFLLQAGIACTIDAPAVVENRMLSGEYRRNIFLTVKEALHNIIKHAQAEKVTIRMIVDHDLVITIQDDGVGYDPGKVRPFSHGLKNMEARMRNIGGKLKISWEVGTLVSLWAPLPG
jgi:signal transduction histidine kinase/ligand-binding sensor domain-containing protein